MWSAAELLIGCLDRRRLSEYGSGDEAEAIERKHPSMRAEPGPHACTRSSKRRSVPRMTKENARGNYTASGEALRAACVSHSWLVQQTHERCGLLYVAPGGASDRACGLVG